MWRDVETEGRITCRAEVLNLVACIYIMHNATCNMRLQLYIQDHFVSGLIISFSSLTESYHPAYQVSNYEQKRICRVAGQEGKRVRGQGGKDKE